MVLLQVCFYFAGFGRNREEIWISKDSIRGRTRSCAGRTRLDPSTSPTADSTSEETQLYGSDKILSESYQTNPETDLEFWKEAERRKVGPEATYTRFLTPEGHSGAERADSRVLDWRLSLRRS